MIEIDIHSFEFNIESNRRLSRMMKFEINDTLNGGYELYDNSNEFFNEIREYTFTKEWMKIFIFSMLPK